ncbi:MAG TPA: right-handed parallel beta-helix repeat-containing protein [Myxococcota bacterium]|nr:right-handed parallel beta-helix repeat-containing protein [Myxococcota bacterium]
MQTPARLSLALSLALAAVAVAGSARAGDTGEGRFLQFVWPGRSIQAALDAASEGGYVLVLPGVYRESPGEINGLSITRGVNLIGLSTPWRKVVLENAGSQRNGIVAVPAEHTECMSCHASLAPPFELLPGVDPAPLPHEPAIYGLTIRGITIRGFGNNGLFARQLDGFAFIDVHSVDNPNYGIFPVSSRNGIITHSSATGADDSGIWIETSEHVAATYNRVENNVNGFEVSNSDDVLLAHNEVRGNTIGMALLFLPDIFDVRPDATRYTVRENHIHDNNRPNTATEGAILSLVPPGIGILHVGVDDSLIEKNMITGNQFIGAGIVDYCLVVLGTPFDCSTDPEITPGFVADSAASNNRVVGNVVTGNGAVSDPSNPFDFARSDLGLLTLGDHGNCYADNVYTTFFSTLGVLPPCP